MTVLETGLKGKKFIIDDEDFLKVSVYKWYINSRSGYVYRNLPAPMKLHRFIMNPPINMDIDHKNRNPLDNRKCNLRICTRSQNMMNSHVKSRNEWGIKGVWYNPKNKYWVVQLRVLGKRVYQKYFKTKEEAALAYNQAAIKYFGEYALLNQL
jgi:hypothetical protein